MSTAPPGCVPQSPASTMPAQASHIAAAHNGVGCHEEKEAKETGVMPFQASQAALAGNQQGREEQEIGNSPAKPSRSNPDGQLKTTSSVADLEIRAPQMQHEEGWKDSWRGYACVHAGRIFQKKIQTIKLLPSEFRRLVGKNRYGHRAAQYTAWRSSLLAVGAFFFAATVSLDIVFLVDPWKTGTSGGQLFLLQHISERYHKHFDELILYNQLHAILLLVCSVFSVLAAVYSAWYCSTFRISRKGVIASFTCSYMPPFLLLLCIPFRHSVDFTGIQKQMCNDVLNYTESGQSEVSTGRGRRWPGKSSDLADILVNTYGIQLSSDFCDQDPTTWGDNIVTMLEDGGFLEENGTCPRADSQVEDLVKVASSVALNVGGINTTNGSVGESIAANAGTAAAAGAEMAAEVSTRAAQIQDSMSSYTENNNTCGSACLNCTTTCLPYLGELAALSSVYDLKIIAAQWLKDLEWGDLTAAASVAANTGTAAESTAASAAESAAGSAADTASSSWSAIPPLRQRLAARCSHCFSWEAGLRCAWDCESVREAVAHAAMVGNVAKETRMCVKPEDLTSLSLLMELGTQTGYWKMLLGAAFAVMSFAQLLPLTFSLLFGAAKGSSIAKSVIPYSRLPDVVSSSAAVFTFPFIFVIVVLIQTVIGTPLTLCGVFFLLGGIMASMQIGTVLKAVSHDALSSRQATMSNISMGCFFLSLIFFILAMGISSLVRSLFRFLKDQGLELTEEDKKAVGSQFTWFIIRLVLMLLGKSLVSTVFFSDGAVTLMDEFHWDDDRDPLEVQCARMRLVEDMHTLTEEQENSEDGLCTVHPEAEDSVSAAQAEKERQDAMQEAAVTALQALIRLQAARRPSGQAFNQEEEDALIAAKTLPELLRAVASGSLGKDASATQCEPAGSGSGRFSAPAVVTSHSTPDDRNQASAKRDSRTVLKWFQRKMYTSHDISPM